MINKHITFFPNKIFKKYNFLDLTFGFGGYNYSYKYVKKIVSFEKEYYSIFLSRKKYKKNFFIFYLKIKNIIFLLKRFNFKNFNILIYDKGFNSCEIKKNFYFLIKKNYKKNQYKIGKNLFFIFNFIIKFLKKNFLIIINIFNIYEYFKIIFFLKKINIKFKILKMNNFEISLNNSIKNSKMFIIYV